MAMLTAVPFCADNLEWVVGDNLYECRAILVPDDDGGFSVYAIRLPGVVSQGDTEEKAIANIKEAFRESIRAYKELGMKIPWQNVTVDRLPGSFERWTVVDVK